MMPDPSIASLTVHVRYIHLSDEVVLVELTWPGGHVTLTGYFVADFDTEGEEWKRQGDGGDG